MIFDMTKRASGGGDYVAADWLDKDKPVGNIVFDGTLTQWDNQWALARRMKIDNVMFTNSTKVSETLCSNSSITNFVGVKVTALYSSCFAGCTKLKSADILGGSIASLSFNNCNVMDTLVIRSTSVSSLGGTNALNNSAFKSGGTGGTIYIPQSLYDHLGDGTSSDYKAATNWSTIDGYGTITWKSIESTHTDPNAPIDLTLYYADGTPIPTE